MRKDVQAKIRDLRRVCYVVRTRGSQQRRLQAPRKSEAEDPTHELKEGECNMTFRKQCDRCGKWESDVCISSGRKVLAQALHKGITPSLRLLR